MSGSNEHKLDEIFVAYRESLPDFEPGPNFTPEIWGRIEQRRKATFGFTRFARVLVTGALALCFVMTAITTSTSSSPGNTVFTATYADVLDQEREIELDTVGESL